MMKSLILTFALLLAAACPAFADSGPRKPRGDRQPEVAAPRAPHLDLFPPSVIDKHAGRQSGTPSRQRPAEDARPAALRFDTGDGWKGDAVVAGAMVGGFAVLAAICSGGACMLP